LARKEKVEEVKGKKFTRKILSSKKRSGCRADSKSPSIAD
jgi:hypothetical protein